MVDAQQALLLCTHCSIDIHSVPLCSRHECEHWPGTEQADSPEAFSGETGNK